MIRNTLAVLMVLALTGCAISPSRQDQTALSHQAPIELSDTVFFPQEKYQCGPAALATILQASGVPATPEAVKPQVYLPQKYGSLRAELVSATRRHGRVPYILAPTLKAILEELNQNRPVLVFQNLGIKAWPAWHFAVVVGYDPQTGEWILRSGTTQRKRQSTSLFLRTWQRGERWAMVALRPGELPADDRPTHYLKAVAQYENWLKGNGGPSHSVSQAYSAAVKRWPHNALAHFAQANFAYQSADYAGAYVSYQKAINLVGDNAAFRNNFALLLAEQGCKSQALAQIETAYRLNSLTPKEKQSLNETREHIRARPTEKCRLK